MLKNGRVEPVKKLYWCDYCNSPILGTEFCPSCGHQARLAKLGNGEIRPIFDTEKTWYKELLIQNGFDPEVYLPNGLCFNYRGSVISDGYKIFRVTYDENLSKWKITIYNNFQKNKFKLKGSNIETILKINRKYLENLEAKSLQFIKDIYIKNKNHSFAVSFSGGKDSVVTLYLAKKVINNFDTIWMNTTIDFPETEKYVHEICKNWDLKLIELKPTKDFFTLWDELGPPSKFMRWCCQTVKFAPLNQYIDSHYEDEVITASGVRKNESNSRSKYDSVQVNKIIPKQILFFPILEWNSLEVWLYMIWKVIPINDVYLKGFSRIGCWLCPEKTLREFKKMEIVYPQLINQLNNKLYEYTENKKIHDVDKWVKDGKWRYRVSRYVKEKIDKRSTCSVKPQYIYNLKNDKKDEVNQFLKIFGPIKQRGKITTIQNHNFDLSIINNTIRVSYYSDSKKIQKIFEKQLERAVNCINCGACIGNCPMNAIKIENNRYTISPTCNYCLNCIKSNGIRKMCIALNYKTNIATIH
jgi:phosphoadenosine phosphosulfate reductase